MDKILILHSSHDGHTRKIIAKMREEMQGFIIDEADLEQGLNCNLSDYQKILIGASIRYGHFNSSVYRFIDRHHAELKQKDAAFFGVNLIARKPEKRTVETNVYMRKFLQRIKWQPKQIGIFAGALCYSRYNWWQTGLIQLIMRITGGSTDKKQDIEFTNWDDVQRFAIEFIAK